MQEAETRRPPPDQDHSNADMLEVIERTGGFLQLPEFAQYRSQVIAAVWIARNQPEKIAVWLETLKATDYLFDQEKKNEVFLNLLQEIVPALAEQNQRLRLVSFFGDEQLVDNLLNTIKNPTLLEQVITVGTTIPKFQREVLKVFKKQVADQPNETELVGYLSRVASRIENNTLCPIEDAARSATVMRPDLARITHTQTLVHGENVAVIPNSGAKTIVYYGPATLRLMLPEGAMLFTQKPNDRTKELAIINGTGSVLETFIDASPPRSAKEAIIFKTLAALNTLQRTEFYKPTENWILLITELFDAIEKQDNVGFHKKKIADFFDKLCAEGLSKVKAVEILDTVEGHSTGGWLLEPEILRYLTKKNIPSTEWEKIFKMAHSKEDLKKYIAALTATYQLKEMEVRGIQETIEHCIPGDNIEHMCRTAFLPFEINVKPHTFKQVLDYIYSVKAYDAETTPYNTFFERISQIILSGAESGDAEETIHKNIQRDPMIWQWLYGKATGNFRVLQAEQFKRVAASNLEAPAVVSGRSATVTTTALRYDASQNAVILKIPLSNIITDQRLLTYQQLRWQQADVVREYILPLEKSPYTDLATILALYPTDGQNFLTAQTIQKACLRLMFVHPEFSQIPSASVFAAIANTLNNGNNPGLAAKVREHYGIGPSIRITEELARNLVSTPPKNGTDTELQRETTDLLATLYKKNLANAGAFIFQKLLSSSTSFASGYHGWGADCHTVDPFVQSLAAEAPGPLCITANSYMGAEGTNLLDLPTIDEPVSLAGGNQDMNSYGAQLVKGLAEFDGLPSAGGVIFGHSMGGNVVLRAALSNGLTYPGISYLSLEPVISQGGDFTVPGDTDLEPEIKHYISLLGASSGEEDRVLLSKSAATITKLVTTPGILPAGIQEALVQVGRILVNKTVYAILVNNSDPTVAQSHYDELINSRATFHAHVTPILEAAKSLSPAEKTFLATELHDKVRIVIAQQDDVLKPKFALWELLKDPAIPQEIKNKLEKMLVLIPGNHYGHLEHTIYRDDPNNTNLQSNQQRVAQVAGQLFTL